MSGLLFLTSKDFNLRNQLLCNNIPGMSLVMFYSTECVHCQKLIPIIKTLPNIVNGCQFAIINVSKNRQIVGMSQKSKSPIKYVPYIILYVNGQPFMRYDGPQKMNEIRKFIFEVHNTIKHKQKFAKQEQKEEKKSNASKTNGIPAYTIGKPLCGKNNVCYLDFNNAYTKK